MESNRERVGEWFKRWRKPIRGWLRNRASVPPGDLDDVAQEVYLRLLRYSDGTVVDNPQGYLFRIAANVATEWRERSRNVMPHDSAWLDELIAESLECQESAFWDEAKNSLVRSELAHLPPRQRRYVEMHVFDGMTYKQIAAAERVTYRIVLRDLTRAYATLRMSLKDIE